MNEQPLHPGWPFGAERPLRRVIVKIGSNVLAKSSGGLEKGRIADLCASVARARQHGIEVIIVTSGAVAAGRGVLGLKSRPTNIPDLQAVAAVGQGALVETYNGYLRPHGLAAAQILLNREDMDDRRRYLNARHALVSLLHHPVVPIINENDSVTVDELKFGDNDMLSALIAGKMEADLLVIMTNVPGLMTGHPTEDPEAKLIPLVEEIDSSIESLVISGTSTFGTGGMSTKLMAARHATGFGVSCIICNGTTSEQLDRVFTGKFEGTLFTCKGQRRAGDSRRHWIETKRPSGELVVDNGAVKALVEGRKSLLPVGIKSVAGTFLEGDVVSIFSETATLIAKGIVNYGDRELTKIAGCRSEEIEEKLGSIAYKEAVHSNNMALISTLS